MGKIKDAPNNDNKKVEVVSIGDYKEKAQEKLKLIKEFEEGPQPIPTCTCGQHTDPNQFLTEKQVTKHYLKDRKRYVKGLKGEDPLEIYMETFKNLMGDAPLVKLSMKTDLASMTYISNYFNEAIKFYDEYIKDEQDLTDRGEITAKELRMGYEEYKEHIVKSLINSYIIDKRWFINKNFEFAWTEDELLKREDTLDTTLNETQGYIDFMEEHFHKADRSLKMHIISTAAQKLDRQINEKLKGNKISSSEVYKLGTQMQKSLDMIKETISHNRQRDLRIIKEKYDKEKDDCSLEHKAKTLIDLELRSREIDGHKYTGRSGFTANSSAKQLTETIGMENLIRKLSTKELATLFEQFKALEEQYNVNG